MSQDLAPTGATRPKATIPRLLPEGGELDFNALRTQGIASCQDLSGEIWTDYNLHDPGVTLLEALCFALTELPFQASAPVEDVLCAEDERIPFERHTLHPPLEVLPARPLTGEDLRRYLLDHVPELEHAILSIQNGLWSIAFHAHGDADAASQVAAAYHRVRNLCEDLAERPRPIPSHPCTLQAEFVLDGPRDPAETLAECFQVAAHFISGQAQRQSLADRIAQGEASGSSLEELLEGPLQLRGWTDGGDSTGTSQGRLFFGDLSRRLQEIPGIIGVHNVALQAPGIEASGTSIPWQGPSGRLHLHFPERPEELGGIRVRRLSTPATLPVEALLRRLQDLKIGDNAPLPGHRSKPALSWELPQGRWIPSQAPISILEHLPPPYRLGGSSELLASQAVATSGEREQFIAYLALFDQWLAHGAAQNRTLSELFSVDGDLRNSYGWQMLADSHLPGIEALCRVPPERIRAEVFERADHPMERRSRVLDFLLALHGEAVSQNRLRTFGWYFEASEWEKHLFDQKQAFAARISQLTRERYGGFDYSRPSLGVEDNTCAFQERVSRLLAFRSCHSRRLLELWQELDLRTEEASDQSLALEGPSPDWHDIAFPSQVVQPSAAKGLLTWLGSYVPLLGEGRVDLAFLRCAVHPDRYWCAPTDYGFQLFLGPDETQRWWRVADIRDVDPQGGSQPSAEIIAQRLRNLACTLMLTSEGMHVVEHTLLRPLEANAPEASPDHEANCMSVIFSGWTSRGQDASFRHLAMERVAQNAPAHIQPLCHWLDLDAFRAFEEAFAEWLEAKRAHTTDPGTPGAGVRLDQASLRLKTALEKAGETTP